MSRGRVTFSAANSGRTDRQHAEFLKHHQSHGMTLHGGFGNHRRPRAVLSEQDYYEERVWDVKRTKQEFIKQELFMPTYAETMSLLNDVHDNLLHEPGHLNYDDYCEFCKEALRSSGLAPKQQEMKRLFHLIDEDQSASLERHEILHAVMANWEVKRLLQNSKTLKPLASVAAWKRAFQKLKQPNRRLAASNTLLRISSNETCARAICEFKRDHDKNSHVNDHAIGGGGGGNAGVWNQATGMYEQEAIKRPILAALAPLLTLGKGKEIVTLNPADKANLARMLSRVPGGAEAVNRLVRRVLHGASICCKSRFVASSIISDVALGTAQRLEACIDANMGDVDALHELLCGAVAGGFVGATECLLEVGVLDPNFRRASDQSPMSASALGGSIPCVKLLLDAGADVNQSHRGGLTPLVFAATRDNAEVMVYLFERGADASVDVNGTNAARLYAEETKSMRAFWAASLLLEIQTLEKLVFASRYGKQGEARCFPLRASESGMG